MQNKLLRNLAILIALIIVVGGIGYLRITPERFLDNAPAQVDESVVDYYAINTHTKQFMDDGSLQYDLTADKVEHHQVSEISYVTLPEMQIYRGTPYPWHVRSERAEVNPDGTQVELIDNVKLNRTDQKSRTTVINTSRATVYPRRQYAETDQDVRIDGANGVTTAKGMKAYLKDSKVDLLSNVRGQYDARSR
ncbi:LPS export ABC transporter periplasmic protein LptC [Pseudomonas sp. KNUC1026]|uniref:LPS export ABC transporter periplasmic protein LptC n=1 Tax=Pseudomonas sp. KNUC1026 TaxID=2893890 RepID=UPI001F26F7D9|nr:LPS export ABC transporter periplasmic protein LptC [Pseudomonas sp. KNUC1026]UFH50173.1 LPS export ABC transporter periplasmic protein LptC [Pseudomonas sp. KNUC1026]